MTSQVKKGLPAFGSSRGTPGDKTKPASHKPSAMSALAEKLEKIRMQGKNRHTLTNVEDSLCDMFRVNDDSGRINVTKFLKALAAAGLSQKDPRLDDMLKNIAETKDQCAGDPQFWIANKFCCDEDVFKGFIMDNIDIIQKALTGGLVIPDFQGFCGDIEEIYNICKEDKSGKVATYIPQLGRADPSLWGACVCTVDGQRFSIGDVGVPFSIQSTSKPISYAIALGEKGPDYVHSFVGQEPSGRSFNELCLDNSNKPHNPMINAGAIMTASLIKPELETADRFDHVLQTYRLLTGGEHMGFNNAVFLSERRVADRNFALTYYMRENKCFSQGTDIVEMLDFYFQMCSLEATCESAAVIAGTLANGGICPITGEVVLQPAAVRNTLCLMHSCGMYDYSGQFAFKCGLPAKSGVSGIVLLVIPNVMGLALFSPALDECGNSARGVKFCEELISRFNFHHFDCMTPDSEKKDPRHTETHQKADMKHKLLFAAAAGDLTSVKRHRLSKMCMEACDYDGRTALHLAAAEGHYRVVRFLLQKCCVPVDVKDRWGNTPVDDARRGGYENITELLLKHCLKSGGDDKLNNLNMKLEDGGKKWRVVGEENLTGGGKPKTT